MKLNRPCAVFNTLLQHHELVPTDPDKSNRPHPAMTLRPETDPRTFIRKAEGGQR